MMDRYKNSPAAEYIFASFIAAFVIWYLWKAASTSLSVENLILIVPAAILALTTLTFAVVTDVSHGAASTTTRDDPTQVEGLSSLGCLVSYAAYIFSMWTIGFDLATFLFIALTMSFSRNTGWLEIFATALIGAIAITYGFKALIPYYQFPTILPCFRSELITLLC